MDPIRPVIRSTDDLADAWRLVDGGHGYSAPQLFVMLVDRDGAMVPSLIHVYDEDVELDDVLVQMPGFARTLGLVLEQHAPGGSVAVMRCRPGSASLTVSDRRWCVALHGALRAAPFASHPIFFATDDGCRIVPPDVLVATP